MLDKFEFQINKPVLVQCKSIPCNVQYILLAHFVIAYVKFEFQRAPCILSGNARSREGQRLGGLGPLRSVCRSFSPDSATCWPYSFIRWLLEAQPAFPPVSGQLLPKAGVGFHT